MKKVISLALFFALCAPLFGCTSQPLYNVDRRSIGEYAKTSPQVRTAILDSANELGWMAREIAPGQIEAKIRRRAHRAIVKISYSDNSYSITHQDSENLDYDGASIHRGYNGWIMNLDNRIRDKLEGFGS